MTAQPTRSKGASARFTARTVAIFGLLALLVSGCAGAQAPTVQRGTEPASRQIKILRIGTTKEPTTGIIVFRGGGTGELNPTLTFHSSLTVYDAQGTLTPRLAENVPSLDNGDWVVDAD